MSGGQPISGRQLRSGGWAHLATVIDCHDREIVGWPKKAERALDEACMALRDAPPDRANADHPLGQWAYLPEPAVPSGPSGFSLAARVPHEIPEALAA
jgi:transposase InsO family protein